MIREGDIIKGLYATMPLYLQKELEVKYRDFWIKAERHCLKTLKKIGGMKGIKVVVRPQIEIIKSSSPL